jgi:tetratricopeptide (TPR) repeat protein
MPPDTIHAVRDEWMRDNARGLALAAAADWSEAAEAFAAAADVVARQDPDDSAHDALALILGNLSQACFRAGRIDDALRYAQRSCALRVAIAGEDALPVARGFMDLAVMLGSAGRLDEAQALAQRAISAAERHVGDDDARLAVIVENAARLAMAAGAPAQAEPLLQRLHALLTMHNLSATRADQLLTMVQAAGSRTGAPVVEQRTDTDSPVMPMSPVVPVAPTVATTPVRQAPASAQPRAAAAPLAMPSALPEWEDQPLRDAVAMTDVLLRATPVGVIAVPEPTTHDPAVLAAFDAMLDPEIELTIIPVEPFADELPSTLPVAGASSAPLAMPIEMASDMLVVPPTLTAPLPHAPPMASEATAAPAPFSAPPFAAPPVAAPPFAAPPVAAPPFAAPPVAAPPFAAPPVAAPPVTSPPFAAPVSPPPAPPRPYEPLPVRPMPPASIPGGTGERMRPPQSHEDLDNDFLVPTPRPPRRPRPTTSKPAKKSVGAGVLVGTAVATLVGLGAAIWYFLYS